MNKKVFILLPDGIGLRNFAFTNFHKIGIGKGFNITFWNATPFQLSELGFNEIKIRNPRAHPVTDLLKKAQIQIELSQNIEKAKDSVYDSYRFPFSQKNFKEALKNWIVHSLIFFNNSQSGLKRIRKRIAVNERKTQLYLDSSKTLKAENPAIVFCTNQRITTAVASILAAQDLGIPTATFIFSWDNLPKGTKIIETDFYIVWSEHMKQELLYYYPYVKNEQILVTGTPQFETHFDTSLLWPKEVFYAKYNLDAAKRYICFSGDDVTTSPYDDQYLHDVAQAVKELNQKGHNLGIVFRRCPVDFSDRYDKVLAQYKDIIVPIHPQWKNIGEGWNTILPTQEDLTLQMNTIYHTEMVINLASSMVFDYAVFNKPCGYIDYEIENRENKRWSAKKIYNFIHFRSMPNKNSAVWLDSRDGIAGKIEEMLHHECGETVENAQKWFEKINQHPPEKASERIWDAIEKIINK